MSKANEEVPPKKIVPLSKEHEAGLSQELKNSLALLQDDEKFQNCSTFRQQCSRLNELFRSDPKNMLSYSKLAKLFDPPINKSSIQQQVIKIQIPPKANGRPSILKKEELEELHKCIEECFSRRYYPTFDEVEDEIQKRFGKVPNRYMVSYFTNSFNYNVILGEPMEEERVMYDEIAVEKYVKDITMNLTGVRRGFLFNCDESGQNDFVDCRKTFVICPEGVLHPFIPVSRSSRKLSVLHTIASDGEWVKPLFVVPRKTLDSDIYRVLPPDSIEVHHQNKGFLNAAIFAHWFSDIFIPHLLEKRKRKHYEGPALLILDGFSAHTKVTETLTDEVLSKFNLRIVYIPPHTSDQLQPLDLIIFGVQKQKYNHIKKAQYTFKKSLGHVPTNEEIQEHYDVQSKHIIDVFRSLWQSSDVSNITKAFELGGFLFTEPELNCIIGQMEQYHIFQPVTCSKARFDVEKLTNKLLENDAVYQNLVLVHKYDDQPSKERLTLEMSKFETFVPKIAALIRNLEN